MTALFSHFTKAGEFSGNITTRTWITDGYFYSGIEQEIEKAYFDLIFDPNGITFPGGKFFLDEVRAEWRRNQSDQPFIEVTDLIYRNGTNVRVVDPGIVFFDKFICPDGLLRESWTGVPTPEAFQVIELDSYCAEAINAPKNAGECKQQCEPHVKRGNPIHTGTGNKYIVETDYQSPTNGGISYRRYYNSLTRNNLNQQYGVGWSADYWQRIKKDPNLNIAEAFRPDGRVIEFRFIGNQWVPDSDVVEQLQEITDAQGNRTGWLFTTSDDTVEEYEIVGAGSRLLTLTDRQGLITTLTYDLSIAQGGDGNPFTPDIVTDPFGKTLRFVFDTNAVIQKVIDPAGNDIIYERDTISNITTVIYPDNTPTSSNDNPRRQYHYEDINFQNNLTGITNENGQRLSTYAYDNEGRAILSEQSGGVDRIDVVYNNDGTTTITDSKGEIQINQFSIARGTINVANINGNACADCGSTQAATYDTNGFIASRNDFNGNLTTFVNDSRGLEISRTQAVGTTEERTIATEWHPTFRLPTKITEPGKITTFTYDAQGRLLSRNEETAP